MAVGTAKVTFEADASKVSAKLTEQVNAALAKIDKMLGGISTSADREGGKAGKAIGDGIESGAQKADKSIQDIGGESLNKVAQTAAKAGQEVASSISGGASKAKQAVGQIDGSSLNKLSSNAATAGAGIASGIQSGASRANNALSQINGSVMSRLSERASQAGAAISSAISRGAQAASQAVSGISNSFPRVSAAVSSAGTAIRNSLKRPLDESHQSALKIPPALSGIASSLAVMAGPMAIFKAGWGRATGFQEAEVRFKSIGVEGKNFTNTMNMLNGVVKGTSAGLDEAASQASMLMTSGVKGGKDLQHSMEALVTASAVGGKSVGDLGLIFQQVSAAGKLQAGDALQLSQASVPIWSWLAKTMGKSVEEVRDLSMAGKISYQDMVEAIRQNGGTLAKDMSNTFKGQVSAIKSAMGRMGEIIARPLLDLSSVVLPLVAKAFDLVSKPLRAVTGWMEGSSVAAQLLRAAFVGLAAAISVGAIGGFVIQLMSMQKVISAVHIAWSALNVGFLFTPVGAAIAGITALVAAIVLLWRNSEGFRNFWTGLWNFVTAPVRAAVGTVKNLFADMWSVLKGDGIIMDSPLQKIFGKETMNEVMANVANVRGSISELREAFAGNDVAPRYLESLVGADAAETIITKVGSVKAAVGELRDAITGKDGGTSALENLIGSTAATALTNIFRMAHSAAMQLWDGVKQIAASLTNLTASLGTAAWSALVSVLSAVWSVLSSLGQAIWGIIQALAPILVPILKVVAVIIGAMLLSSMVALVAALKVVAVVFQALGKVISWVTNTILVPLIDALSAVVSWIVGKLGAAISGVVEFIGGLISGIIGFFTGLGGALGSVWEGIKSGWDSIWQWMQSAWDAVGRPLVDIIVNVFLFALGSILLAWDWLKDKFSSVWSFMGEVWAAIGQPVVDFIKTAWDGLMNALQTGWDYVVQAFTAAWTWIQQVWAAVGQPVIDFIKAAFDGLVSALSTAWEWIKARWSDLWNFVVGVYNSYIAPVVGWIKQKFGEMQSWISAKLDAVKSAITAAGSAIKGLYDRYVAPMVAAVVSGFQRVVSAASNLKNSIVGAVAGAGSWLVNAGRQVVQGMINGIRSMVGSLVSTVANMAKAAINRAKSALGIHSPSREFRAIGVNVGEGMVMGMQQMAPKVAAAAENMSAVSPTVSVDSEITGPATQAASSTAVSVTPTFTPPSFDSGAFNSDAPAGFTAAAQAMKSTADGTVIPMFKGLNSAVGGFSSVVAKQSLGVSLPSFQAMAAGMAQTQNSVIAPTMTATGQSTTNMAAVMWQQMSGTIANSLKYFVQMLAWAYTNGVQFSFTNMGNSMSWLVNMFTWGVNNIGAAWARIRELTAQPVRFTIGTVFNNGLVGMWNSVAELLGTNKMNPYPLRFATGGYVRGPGGPTGDKIPALLSDKEYVLNAKAVQKIGVQNLHALNSGSVSAAPNSLRTDKDLEGMKNDHTFKAIASRYAGGGIVEGSPAWKALLRGYKWAQSRSGRPYVWGGSAHGASGTDCSGFMSGIADVILGGSGARQWATGNFPGTQGGAWARGLAAGFSVGIRNGGPGGGHTAGTIGGVPGIPAVNVESGGSPSRVKFGAGAVGATDGYFNQHHHLRVIDGGRFVPGTGSGVSVQDLIAEAVKPYKDKLTTATRAYGRKPGLISQLPGKAKDKLVSAAQAKMDKLMEAATTDPGGTGVERWRPMAMRAMARVGFNHNDPRQVSAMLAQIASESGGNHNIAQQIHDINGTGESAGVGLLQIIPGTFAAHRDPALPNDRRNPFANMVAALRYYKARYGMDLTRMWGHGHGYAHGGLMGEGKGMFHKTAIKPERVLSPRQTAAFEQLVDWLSGGVTLPSVRPETGVGTNHGYGEPVNTRQVVVTQNIVAADPQRTADAIENRLMSLM